MRASHRNRRAAWATRSLCIERAAPAVAAQPTYRAGDLVALKSAGRTMTVMWAGPVLFDAGHWAICQWFDDAGELCQEMFPEAMLVAAHRTLTS
ncbi:YodC family protein [Paraburkholderia kururiensis]|uniref:YodC family protein n=1 Tax=Paraburkholderia kururiensis TaxID=984307 RepID=UPI0009DDF844